MKQLPSANATPMAVGIQFSVGLSALGCELNQIKQALQEPQHTLTLRDDLIADRDVWVGQYTHPLCSSVPDTLQSVDSRNLRFALTALSKIETELKAYTASFENKRLAIVVGTSTSGIADNELLLKQYFQGQTDLSISHYPQEMSCLAKALQQYLGWEGPAYTISTACSSSAKALAAGQRLLHADLADVVLVGGVDTLCKLTLNGFNSLESLSAHICQPCGISRDGINIGEAAAFFVLSNEQAPVMLMGTGESMDAWHISAPHPEGKGAALAMQRALDMARISAQEVGYINLHGTATPQNDAMEIKAVRQVFGDYQVALSSTKHKTGHCLGAAGAIEAFICEQVLKDQSWLPLHQNVEIDPDLADQNYVQDAELKQPIRYVMSNSFAFGGSNISLVFGVEP
ncbi:beta-ketoacyl-[acyl-carrier-protein] synthase family protein [Acinetobacter pittii]|uniref:beta-ketoacyl-[acyl-carrier-protein] synthase family protein n=1 Tax=Acinetobacter pittii TaxID=48296 RepID=UPI00083AC135|nr:beta-ketoacyl-[acyl-carrier-protein] synthase family protein [Acinetobacter pittii]OCZ70713.1 beta-ketoacyl-[acyl-carrier-protein] synthase II [Acinetobacter pittii]